MSNPDPDKSLSIKKYSNRRFYDTTRSCHVTLGAMHDLICEGYELTIIDGKSGDDITNIILTQIILERDPPKLAMFPSNVLHQVIRTQRELLGSVAEQFFAQVLETHKTSQEKWQQFIQNTLGVSPTMPTNPMEWTRSLMASFTPPPPPKTANDETEALRRQVEELTRQMQRMADANDPPAGK